MRLGVAASDCAELEEPPMVGTTWLLLVSQLFAERPQLLFLKPVSSDEDDSDIIRSRFSKTTLERIFTPALLATPASVCASSSSDLPIVFATTTVTCVVSILQPVLLPSPSLLSAPTATALGGRNANDDNDDARCAGEESGLTGGEKVGAVVPGSDIVLSVPCDIAACCDFRHECVVHVMCSDKSNGLLAAMQVLQTIVESKTMVELTTCKDGN